MATKELQDIIDSLPDIAKHKYPFCECYAFNNDPYHNYNEVLLDSGLIVKADARVNYHGMPDLKVWLKNT